MSIAKKTVLFLFSLFSSIMFVSMLSLIISPMVQELSLNVISNIIYPLFFTIGLLFFIFIQALFRYIMNKKTLSANSTLLSINISRFTLKEKLWLYLLVAVVYFASFFKGIILDYTLIIRILLFVGTIVIIEALLRLSNKNMKIYFLRKGIVVSGFDIRVEIPFGQSVDIHNDSGVYSYYDIDSYFIFPEHVELYLINEQGKLEFKIDEETKRQVMGILVQQKIEMRKFS